MRQLPIGIPQVLEMQAITNVSLCVFVATLQVVPLQGAEQTGASLQSQSCLVFFSFVFFLFFFYTKPKQSINSFVSSELINPKNQYFTFSTTKPQFHTIAIHPIGIHQSLWRVVSDGGLFCTCKCKYCFSCHATAWCSGACKSKSLTDLIVNCITIIFNWV